MEMGTSQGHMSLSIQQFSVCHHQLQGVDGISMYGTLSHTLEKSMRRVSVKALESGDVFQQAVED